MVIADLRQQIKSMEVSHQIAITDYKEQLVYLTKRMDKIIAQNQFLEKQIADGAKQMEYYVGKCEKLKGNWDIAFYENDVFTELWRSQLILSFFQLRPNWMEKMTVVQLRTNLEKMIKLSLIDLLIMNTMKNRTAALHSYVYQQHPPQITWISSKFQVMRRSHQPEESFRFRQKFNSWTFLQVNFKKSKKNYFFRVCKVYW